jgi:hypothetical protein
MQPLESIRHLSLPPQVESRMRELMRRQSERNLSESERHELTLIIEAEELLAQVRSKARTLLDSVAPAPSQPVRTVRNGLPVVQVPPGTATINPDAVRRFLQEEAF